MTLAYPWVLALFPLLLLIRFILSKRNKNKANQSLKLHFFNINPTRGILVAYVPKIVQLIGLFLIIFALARPQEKMTKVKRSVFGIDIMLIMDMSQSMLIEDFQPKNRLYVAKEVVKNFITKRPNDRIGLVLFSGDAYAAVPLTLDHDIIRERIDEAVLSDFEPGTAIGVALATGVNGFTFDDKRERIAVLLTDGDNNAGKMDPITAAEVAKDKSVKVYTIGIGRNGRAPMPLQSQGAFGAPGSPYQYVTTKVDTETLKKISNITGGSVFRAESTDVLIEVFDKIDQLEKTKIEANELIRFTELYQSYLFFGILFLLLGFLLGQSILRVLRAI